MGKGKCDEDCGCKLKSPLNYPTFFGALCLLLLSMIWFIICLDGLFKIPKCRYGDESGECYFVRPTKGTDIAGNIVTVSALKNRAVEGSSDSGMEQLAIPLLVTLLSIIAPVLIFFATVFEGGIRTIEVGKFWLTACIVSMLFSIRIVDNVTFDCRWWRNTNQDTCKSAFNQFAAGAFFTMLTEISLVTVAIFHGEKERDASFQNIDQQGLAAAGYSDDSHAGAVPGGGRMEIESNKENNL